MENKIKGFYWVSKSWYFESIKDKIDCDDEVSSVLCEGCKVGLNSVFVESDQTIYHPTNGVKVPCLASSWRYKIAKEIFKNGG